MATAALIGGTAISAYGQYKSSKARATAMRAQADAKRLQAFELLERNEINVQRTREKGELFKAEQITAFAASGVEISEGTPLSVLEDTSAAISKNIADQKREAEFKAEQLFAGADIDTRLSKDVELAGTIGAVGTVAAGAGQAYLLSGKGKGTS